MKKPKVSAPLTISYDALQGYQPITKNQELAFQAWDDGDHLVLAGTAGTGKTFIGLYLILSDLLEPETQYDKIVIIRSVVPTRDQGFLPGTQKEKEEAYAIPYKQICTELFGDPQAYGKMVSAKQLHFESTSFIRGQTFNNALILVDEMQNLNFHELDSVITRVGKNCRVIFAGDYKQSDFKKEDEREGILKFLRIIDHMNDFTTVTFGWQDIVRSGLVRDYIMTKEMLGID
jgi:phosphate starvation-inducible protein PhoH and related proteins